MIIPREEILAGYQKLFQKVGAAIKNKWEDKNLTQLQVNIGGKNKESNREKYSSSFRSY